MSCEECKHETDIALISSNTTRILQILDGNGQEGLVTEFANLKGRFRMLLWGIPIYLTLLVVVIAAILAAIS